MTNTTEIFVAFPKEKRRPTVLFVLVGYVLALALYYVDEGNYHFTNLIEYPLEWIFVSMYALLIAGCIGLVYKILPQSKMSYRSRLLSGIVLGVLAIPAIIILVGILVPLLTP